MKKKDVIKSVTAILKNAQRLKDAVVGYVRYSFAYLILCYYLWVELFYGLGIL